VTTIQQKKIGKRKKTVREGMTRVKIFTEELAAKTCGSWNENRKTFDQKMNTRNK